MTDYSVPQRMSLEAFLIYIFKYSRNILGYSIPVFVSIFISVDLISDGVKRLAIVTGIAFGVALLSACAAYFSIRIFVSEGSLIYRHNILRRVTTTIPLNRIHSLRTSQNLAYRLLNMRCIHFDTLATKDEEIELILRESDWQSLLNLIERQEREQSESPDLPPVYIRSSKQKFSNTGLLLDALCQNHFKGMAVLGSLAAVIFNAAQDISENAVHKIADYLELFLSSLSESVAGIIMFLAAVYIVAMLLWLGKTMLKYFDLSLVYDRNMLSFSSGLFSRTSSRFAYDKICTLWVKRNFIEKRFGMCALSLKQAFNASANKEEDNLKIYGRDNSDFFLSWWLGENFQSETDIIIAKSGKGVITATLLPSVIISAIAIVVLHHFGQYAWLSIPAVYLAISVPKGIYAMRHSSISLKESHVIIGNGHFAEIKNYMKYCNIETVRLKRTPISRLTGRVALHISTPGTAFSVRSLRENAATQIYELLLARSDKLQVSAE